MEGTPHRNDMPALLNFSYHASLARAGSSRHSPILRSSSLVLKRQSNATSACLHERRNPNWRASFRVRNWMVGPQQLRPALILAGTE